MYGIPKDHIKFTRHHQQVLRETVITNEEPGTILRDFAAFVAYFQEQPRALTNKHQLKLKDLEPLNARLTHPIQHRLKRPQQKSLPHIHGLYLLLRASGLTTVDSSGRAPVLVIDSALITQWQKMNPTERYCTLLETWLLRGRPQIISESDSAWRTVPETFGEWGYFFTQIPNTGLPVAGDPQVDERIRYSPGWHHLGLLGLFGLLDVQPAPPQPGAGWQVAQVARTPLGDALLGLLYTEFFGNFDNILTISDDVKATFGALRPALQSYWTDWQTDLRPPDFIFREGVYIFKVMLWKDIWWRIAIPADCVLDELAYAILRAAQFDSDHLHRFSYQNRYGVREDVNHAYMDEGPWTSEVRVGDVPLYIGQTMDYNFDFGDNWHFAVTLERVDPADNISQKATVLESHGKPPEQYR